MRADRKVVVVTGASSGIGRATALRLAREGHALALAARRPEALEEVRFACLREGALCVDLATDVTDPRAVEALLDRAVSAFGGVDAWVNAAGVAAVGRFEDTPLEAFRRVVETDLLGVANAAKAVLPHFRRRGAGVLVNVASFAVGAPAPYLSAFHAAKAGVVALSESLRLEVPEGVHVCVVVPPPTETSLWSNAANYTGRALKAPPLQDADAVAAAIAECVAEPRREVVVGVAQTIERLANVAPDAFGRLTSRFVEAGMLGSASAPPSPGNLFVPSRIDDAAGRAPENA